MPIRTRKPTTKTTKLPLIGVATADITPPVGICLSGYGERRSTSVGHRLRAETLVCRHGRTAWALVIAETIGFSAANAAVIRQAIGKRLGIPADQVLLSATHTHSGPPTLSSRHAPGSLEERYNTRLATILERLAAKADAAAKPGTFETMTVSAPEWGHNRRIRKEDGSWGNEWQDPERRHPGYFDPDILMVGVRRPSGRLDALLLNYGCHPVNLGPQSLAISGDYVSYLKDALERTGVARTVIFALAGHGNINPPLCILKGSRQPRRMGEALARTVRAAVNGLQPLPAGLPLASASLPWRIRRRGSTGWRHSEVMALRAGGLGVVSLPGELFSEYTAWIRRASPLSTTVVLSLGNDYIGYLPTDAAQLEGAMEARNAAGDMLEKPLMAHVAKALRAVTKG